MASIFFKLCFKISKKIFLSTEIGPTPKRMDFQVKIRIFCGY